MFPDPFGYWRNLATHNSTDEDEVDYIGEITDQVVEAHYDSITDLIAEAVSAGVVAERARVLAIIRDELNPREDSVKTVIKLIEGDE